MATNSKLSQALKGNRNAAKDYVSKAGSKIGGIAEAVKGRVNGAVSGAKAGSAVAGLQNATYKRGSSSTTKLINKASKAVSGAKVGYKAGAAVAKASPVGEIKGRAKASQLFDKATGRKADGNTMATAKSTATEGKFVYNATAKKQGEVVTAMKKEVKNRFNKGRAMTASVAAKKPKKLVG